MKNQVKSTIAVLLCGLGLCVAWGQEASPPRGTSNSVQQTTNANRARRADRTLSQDDRLSLIAAALDSKTRLNSERDCSHLVHAIYERAGFPYAYASSSDLYAGAEGFQRIAEPQPGDLVVWRGHAGIVIQPSHHIFFSYMRGGPGIDDYDAPYWISRGRPRFYRYRKDYRYVAKNARCAGCARPRPSN
jgi:hypothetical protein